jgi:hypothetical protein
MRFVRGDVRDHIASQKTTTDLRIDAKEHRGIQKSTFARFLTSFDFRLFDSIRHKQTFSEPVDTSVSRR